MEETSLLPTIILRHRKENLKKCSLKGLEKNKNFLFFTYPKDTIPSVSSYVLLTLEGPILTKDDANKGIFLIDGTWNYSEKMKNNTPFHPSQYRSLPHDVRTAYKRKQTKCLDEIRGLASIEALYIAFHILGKDTSFLLDNYYWKDRFLQINNFC